MRTTQAPGSNRYPMHAGRDIGHLETSAELFTARYFQHAAHVRGTGCDGPHLDWRLIQDAEANAREIATRAYPPGLGLITVQNHGAMEFLVQLPAGPCPS